MLSIPSDQDRLRLTLDEDAYQTALVGVDPAAEANNRRWAAFLIADACILLQLPRATCATAQILLHRYYCRVPMSGHDPLVITAMSSLFLATKVEESRRKIRDILSVFHLLLNRYYGLPDTLLDINSNQYIRWRSGLLSSEQTLLSELGFMVFTSHPHKFLLSYIQRLSGGRELAQAAWNFINDFQTTVDCLRFSPEKIASAAVMFGARMLQLRLPDSPPWYELFGSTKDELLQICTLMAKIYHSQQPLEYNPLNDADRIAFKEIEEDHRMLIESQRSSVKSDLSPAAVSQKGLASSHVETSTGRDRSRSQSRESDRRRHDSCSPSSDYRVRRKRPQLYHSRRNSRSRSRDRERRRSRSHSRSRSRDHGYRSSDRYDRRQSYGRSRR